jgi:uncharacterized protein (TIGR02246 family)
MTEGRESSGETPSAQSPEDGAGLAAPEDVVGAWVAAWNRGDADALADLFDADAEFVNVVGLWWHDREAIRRAHAYGLSRIFPGSTLRPGAVRVKRLGDDVATVQARMTLVGQAPAPGAPEPEPRRNVFTFVMHRVGEGWRCAAAHNTDIVPGAETNVVQDGRIRGVDYRAADEEGAA